LVEILHAVKKTNSRIQECSKWLFEELQTGNLRGRLFVEGMANVLASELVFNFSPDRFAKPIVHPDPTDRKMNDVINYIMYEYDNKISVAHMAAKAHISIFHFCRWFKKKKGISPYRFVTNMKMEKAKMLLRDNNKKLTLSQIASLVGYGDVYYFLRVFKKYVGVTPTEFRNGI
jgi:AraC family transcriptional regulator